MPDERRPRRPRAAVEYSHRAAEAQMEQTIRDLVELRGGHVFHLRDARNAPEMEGFPDLVIICPPVLALVELKSAKRKIEPKQAIVNAMLGECTRLVTGIYRPWDLDDLLEELA
jgi:hypothetical protein